MISNEKVINYKFIALIDIYIFDFGRFSNVEKCMVGVLKWIWEGIICLEFV